MSTQGTMSLLFCTMRAIHQAIWVTVVTQSDWYYVKAGLPRPIVGTLTAFFSLIFLLQFPFSTPCSFSLPFSSLPILPLFLSNGCNFQLNKRGYKPNGSSCPVDKPMGYSIIIVTAMPVGKLV